MIKALAVAVALAALLVGCDGGGAKDAGPVPTGQGSQTSTSTEGGTSSSSSGGSTSSASTPLCGKENASVEVDSQEGAAGTIMTTWRVTNTSSSACRSFGYPGMDFHAANGWLGVEVHRGGVEIINQPPAAVLLGPGQSLYFVSLWGDVDTQAGPCTPFDRIKVTLPDNFESARVVSRGCVDPGLVRVGPVTDTPPS